MRSPRPRRSATTSPSGSSSCNDRRLPGIEPAELALVGTLGIHQPLLGSLTRTQPDPTLRPQIERRRPADRTSRGFAPVSRDARYGAGRSPVSRPTDCATRRLRLAISSGANPKVVQRMLGHVSAAMTLDVYADLFESDLDAVAVTVSKMCPRWADSQ
jgi:hypothetical protein